MDNGQAVVMDFISDLLCADGEQTGKQFLCFICHV